MAGCYVLCFKPGKIVIAGMGSDLFFAGYPTGAGDLYHFFIGRIIYCYLPGAKPPGDRYQFPVYTAGLFYVAQ